MTTDVLDDTPPAGPVDSPPEAPSGRREFFRACGRGGAFAAIPLVALLLMNGVNFLSDSFTTRFYAAQARALIHGQWNIPRSRLAFEAFRRGNGYYMYYGPFPSFLRIPIVNVIPGLAERATQPMMLAAIALALVCTARILWSARLLIRPDRALTQRERRWAAVLVFVVGAGSAFTFLTSQAWVYHEAEAWGAALAIASFDAMLVWLRRPSRWSLIAASGFAWASVLSRASVGFGPIGALGLLTLVVAWPRLRGLAGVSADIARRKAIGLAAAAFVPMASYCYVNYAKFGNLFVFPTAAQEMSRLNPGRQFFLEHSNNSYFSTKFIPTTLVQYLRPDALRLSTLLPFIEFPSRAHVFGNVVFDAREPTSSVPASMPFLFALACVAIVVAFRRRRRDRPERSDASTFRIPLIGAAIGAVSVLPFGYIAQRYLSDFLPLLVLGAAVGLQTALRWSEDREAETLDEVGEDAVPARRRWWSPKVVWRALTVLAVLSVAINISLAVSYHYTTDWNPQEISAPFIDLQYTLHHKVLGGAGPKVERGAKLPAQPGPRGTVFVVGDCDGVYWSPGPVNELAWGPWQGVARGPKAGEYRFRVNFTPTGNKRIIEPIVVRGKPGHLQMIAAFVGPGPVVNFAFSSEGHEDLPRGNTTRGFFVGQIEHIKWGKDYDLTAIMDPNNGHVTVKFNGDTALRFIQFELTPQQNGSYVFPTDTEKFGVNPYDKTTEKWFSGTLQPVPVPRPKVCKSLGTG